MGNIFARLLEEGEKQQQQLKGQQVRTTERTEPTATNGASDSTTARQQPVRTARHPDSKLSRQHDSTQEYIATFLDVRATNKTTLRYPHSLMSELDDVLYQTKKTYGITLSKNEIFVFALAYVLYDFKRNATRSGLYKMLLDKEK
jgi:hypothetical protein